MYHSFFIHSSVHGHRGSFHVLAIVSSAAVNIRIHVSFSNMVSPVIFNLTYSIVHCWLFILYFFKVLVEHFLHLLNLCLFWCLSYRVVVTIFFLNSIICVNIQYLSFSFWLIALCIAGSSFIHLIRTDSNVFFFIPQ